MKQVVKVQALNPDGTALVLCKRESACGGNCTECGGCGDGSPKMMEVIAENSIGAKPGDQVVVESSTGQVLAIVLAVYLVPVLLLILGALLWGLPGSLLGLALGFGAAVALDRHRSKRNRLSFVITAYAYESPNHC